MKKKIRFVLLCCLSVGYLFSTIYAQADNKTDSQELEQLLDDSGDEVEVETEQEYGLPVPAATEEDSPVLSESEEGPLVPGDKAEELFLPVPSDQTPTPVGAGISGLEDEDITPFNRAGEVHYEMQESGLSKPGFVLFGGRSFKTYETALVKDAKDGLELGLSARIINSSVFKMPISLHALGAITFTSLVDVPYSFTASDGSVGADVLTGVKDTTFRVGAVMEWEFTRRFQLMGGILKYFNEIDTSIGGKPSADLVVKRLHENRYTLGVGAQYEVYVIPHGSLGIRAWAEIRYFSILLTFSMEPIPRNRNSLNFELDD